MRELVGVGKDRWECLLCPSTDRQFYRDFGFLSVVATDYGYNELGYGRGGLSSEPGQQYLGLSGTPPIGPRRVQPTRESEVRVPADMLAVGDGFCLGPYDTVVAGASDGLERREGVWSNWSLDDVNDEYGLRPFIKAAELRHFRRANVGYCDGHVEAMTFKALFLDKSNDSLRRWNKDHEPHRVN